MEDSRKEKYLHYPHTIPNSTFKESNKSLACTEKERSLNQEKLKKKQSF